MELLTNSRRKAFNLCRYLHHLSYDRAIKPARDAEPLTFGKAAHLCLEAYWKARQNGSDCASDWMFAELANCTEIDAYQHAKLGAMLAGYVRHWGPIECEVLRVEAEFTAPMRHPETGRRSKEWQLGGKIDLLLKLDDGRIAIVEHKTSGDDVSEGTVYREKLAMAGQPTQYIEGARALGIVYDVVIFDVLVKPDLRPLKATPVESRKYTEAKPERRHSACKGKGCDGCTNGMLPAEPSRLYANLRERDETPEEYGERCAKAVEGALSEYIVTIEVPRLDSEMERFRHDTWQAAHLIQLTRKFGIHDRNEDACFKFNRPCAYFGHCTGTASLDDPTQFRVGAVHEELSPPIAAE